MFLTGFGGIDVPRAMFPRLPAVCTEAHNQSFGCSRGALGNLDIISPSLLYLFSMFSVRIFARVIWNLKIRFVQKDVKESSEPSDFQALTREEFDCFADEDGELHLHQDHVDFKGKDRHDTDGRLSLGLGEASRRVDVPVSVKQLVDKAIRSPQSVVGNQSLRVEKTMFMKGSDGAPRLTGYLRARWFGNFLMTG